MNHLAQITPTIIDGQLCTLNDDQSVFLIGAWFILVILNIILLIVFYRLKRRKVAFAFAAYLVSLLLARLLLSTDVCNHGGLFEISGNGTNIMLAFIVLTIITTAAGAFTLVSDKRLKK